MNTKETESQEITSQDLDEKSFFALDKYSYTQQALFQFIDRLSESTSVPVDYYKSTLEDGGGKAFGLRVCEAVSQKFRGGKYTLSVPEWEVAPAVELIDSASFHTLLRSSDMSEDWLDPRGGTFQTFDFDKYYNGGSYNFEHQREDGTLPKIPYVLQDKADGVGIVVDVGLSKVLKKVVARVASGNIRRVEGSGFDYFTSATDDSEAGVAIWDAQTADVEVPLRSFHKLPTFMENSSPEDNFIQSLRRALLESGIDFGVQLEIIVHPADPYQLHLVQLRPTPGNVYRQIPKLSEQDTIAGKEVALTGIVNGAFHSVGTPAFFEREDIENNFNLGRDSESRQGSGKVGVYLEDRYTTFDLYHPGIVPPNAYLGGFIRGCDAQITPRPIKPNTKHGSITSYPDADEAYEQLDSKCGMVSLTKSEIDALRKAVDQKRDQIQVVSDGLVASVSVVKGK